ncbi:Lysosomal acid phosphatase [Leucoagaricus sp. SymC.cos]|nr:Lysosomal acid phosphatase [Leucoagaricus sp. SymC.cos]
MSNSNNGQVMGAVMLVRHGDRLEFFQDPKSYDPQHTFITPLGTHLQFSLFSHETGSRINSSSPDLIQGINTTIADTDQITARADAGGEGGVILTSSIAFLQGLYPPTRSFNEVLANGTNVTGALDGYQVFEAVSPTNDISLEGWTMCGAFEDATTAFYNSAPFQQKAKENADFLNSLKPFLDNRTINLENMWNIFDFLNVRSIHDPIFASRLPPSTLARAQDLANFHEHGVFTSPWLDGIGNIAGRTILPSILGGLADIADPSNNLKILFQGLSYKPLISLFNMTGVDLQSAELAGIVNYAAAAILELRSSNNGPVLRLQFKNGTQDNDFHTLNMFGTSGDLPLSTFVNKLSGVTINDTATWCRVCHNTQDRGCGDITLGAAQAIAAERLRPVGAGLLGAGMGVAFILILIIFAYVLGFMRCRKKRQSSKKSVSSEVRKKC